MNSQSGFRSVWEDFEDKIVDRTEKFLTIIFPSLTNTSLVKARSKSVFPELKVMYEGNAYAIDVKSGEDVMDPWYDMGRLDTFEEKHLDKYKNEYYITVKWHRKSTGITIMDLYIEPFFKSVGSNNACGGVKYRPYDGKLRPKSWDDFAEGKSYWQTVGDFKKGLQISRSYRSIEMIGDWYQKISPEEKNQCKKLLEKIDHQSLF